MAGNGGVVQKIPGILNLTRSFVKREMDRPL
jgi:hypothetical protein